MRKFKTCSRRSLPFRLLVILAGALLLLAAFAPRANADCPACIRYYDFEGPVVRLSQVHSHVPALEQGRRRSLCSSKMTMALSIPPRISQPTRGLSLETNCPPGPTRTRSALVSTVQGRLI